MTYIIVTVFAALVGVIFYLVHSKNQLSNEANQFIQEKAGEFVELEHELEMARFELYNARQRLEEYRQSQPDYSNVVSRELYEQILKQYEDSSERLEVVQAKYSEMVSKQKSSEVRLGAIAETLTPFLNGFPYNPKNLRALGSPIDYIAFEEDEIVLIEVKSGDSVTSKKQKNIQRIVEEGKVRFEVHRINKEGLKIE